MTPMFVTNEAVCGGCGQPTRGKRCECHTHNQHDDPEPLGLPAWNFELPNQQDASPSHAACASTGVAAEQQQVHNRDDAPLGLPSWDDVYASAACPELVQNLQAGNQHDDDQPLGLPVMPW